MERNINNKMIKIDLKRLNPLAAFAKSREIIGIDLSSHNLKIARLKTSLKNAEVVNLLCKSTANLSDDDIARVAGSMLIELGPINPMCVDIISSHIAITKNIEIPSCNPDEIKEIIGLQAGRHTPYSREEIIVDYIPIGQYKNSYTKILLVIVARSVIKRHCEILHKAGLTPEKILFAPEGLGFSCSRILKFGTDMSPVSLAHIEEGFTDFSVIFKNRPVFLRSIPIGAKQLSEEKELYLAKFTEELKKSFESYQGEDIERSPQSLVVTGAAIQMKELEYQLSGALRLPVRPAPYFSSLLVSAEVLRKAQAECPYVSFLDVIGCLLSYNDLSIDLTPEEIKLRKAIEERGRDLIKTGVFVLTIIVLSLLMLIGRIYFKGAELARLKERTKPLTAQAEKLEKDYERVLQLKNYLKNRGRSLELLAELYKIIPLDLELDDIRLDEQAKFSLSGVAGSMSSVFSFVDAMEKSLLFKDVKIRHTTKRKDGARNVTDFEIISEPERGGE